jgi:hypothetical protein
MIKENRKNYKPRKRRGLSTQIKVVMLVLITAKAQTQLNFND